MHVARRTPREREVKLASTAKVEVRKHPRSGRQSRVYAATLAARKKEAPRGRGRGLEVYRAWTEHSPRPDLRTCPRAGGGSVT